MEFFLSVCMEIWARNLEKLEGAVISEGNRR